MLCLLDELLRQYDSSEETIPTDGKKEERERKEYGKNYEGICLLVYLFIKFTN